MQLSAGEAILSLCETQAPEEDENGEQPGKYPKPREETAAALGRAQMAPGRGSTSSLGPRQTVLNHTKLLPGCLVRSLR